MKKLLIHYEYVSILNLLALVFLVMFYQQGSAMFWALLIFLDAAALLLKVDIQKVMLAIKDEQLKQDTQRIKIYLFGIGAFYIYILFTQELSLLVVIIINDLIGAGLSYLFSNYIWKEDAS